MRRPLVAGNWKMYGSRSSARGLLDGLRERLVLSRVEVAVCPPFPFLGLTSELLAGTSICYGAQNLHFEPEGAFTGEVSGAMLRDFGCSYVIVGHSERRQYFGDTDDSVAQKACAALREGLVPIVCVGESEAEREAGSTLEVVGRQLSTVSSALGGADTGRIVVAYEPVWAIGTGKTATPDQAQEVHAFIRRSLREVSPDAAESVRVLYGGSVKAGNARDLFAEPDIDGALVGGASLKAEEFAAICSAAEGH